MACNFEFPRGLQMDKRPQVVCAPTCKTCSFQGPTFDLGTFFFPLGTLYGTEIFVGIVVLRYPSIPRSLTPAQVGLLRTRYVASAALRGYGQIKFALFPAEPRPGARGCPIVRRKGLRESLDAGIVLVLPYLSLAALHCLALPSFCPGQQPAARSQQQHARATKQE